MAGFDFNKGPDERLIVTFGDGRSVQFNEDQANHEEVVVPYWYIWGVAVLIGIPSLTIAGVSGIFNALFAWSLGSSTLEKLAWTAASLVFTTLVVGLPVAISVIKAADPKTAGVARRLWYGCVAFSMISALGFMSRSGDERTATKGASIDRRDGVRSRIANNEARLAQIGRRPPADVIDAQIKALRIDPGAYRRSDQCTKVTRDDTRKACQPLLDLQRTWQEAKAVEQLSAQIEKDRNALDGMPVVGNEANPQSALFERLTLGMVPAHVFEGLMALLITVLIECVSAYGLHVTASVASTAMLHRRRAFAKEEEEPLADLPLLPANAPQMLDAQGAARLAMADTADSERRLLLFAKGTTVNDKQGFGYRFEDIQMPGGIATSRLRFEIEPVRLTADELLGRGTAPAPVRETIATPSRPTPMRRGRGDGGRNAVEWLRAALEAGPREGKELKVAAAAAGFHHPVLYRAGAKLGVQIQPSGVRNLKLWRLPR